MFEKRLALTAALSALALGRIGSAATVEFFTSHIATDQISSNRK